MEVKLKGFLLLKKDESLTEYLIIDNMGRIKIPPLFLKNANIHPSSKIQFFNYKTFFVMRQVKFLPVRLEKKAAKNLTRSINELGCIVIPKMLREIHDINLYEEIEVKVINTSIVLKKKKEENKPAGLIREPLEPELNKLSLLEIKEGRVKLPSSVLKSLNLEEHIQLQFFIKGNNTIIAKKHKYEFPTEGILLFTGQSRVIKKDKYLNIPKKLRDYLNIYNGDTLEITTLGDQLIIKKAL
ncbi:AbrB/MazE/SpoVT family DNA-binding domain-containing protein [Priestia megaterium]|uniref:AbrB/MazE/SpoVT family DNA-binding domain-containing protein n=1 Tax=Priestia megaterium TaxID=1404 RepID=UPI0030015F73